MGVDICISQSKRLFPSRQACTGSSRWCCRISHPGQRLLRCSVQPDCPRPRLTQREREREEREAQERPPSSFWPSFPALQHSSTPTHSRPQSPTAAHSRPPSVPQSSPSPVVFVVRPLPLGFSLWQLLAFPPALVSRSHLLLPTYFNTNTRMTRPFLFCIPPIL